MSRPIPFSKMYRNYHAGKNDNLGGPHLYPMRRVSLHRHSQQSTVVMVVVVDDLEREPLRSPQNKVNPLINTLNYKFIYQGFENRSPSRSFVPSLDSALIVFLGDVTPASRRANGRPSVVMDETAIAELPRRTGSRRIPASRSRTKANPRETTTASSARTTTIPIVTTTELPRTSFTCQGKTLGGYYADPEADCQLFHICSQGRHGR